jgi:hypothetical protein
MSVRMAENVREPDGWIHVWNENKMNMSTRSVSVPCEL